MDEKELKRRDTICQSNIDQEKLNLAMNDQMVEDLTDLTYIADYQLTHKASIPAKFHFSAAQLRHAANDTFLQLKKAGGAE